eukprot:TRINITY_DN329_c0_g1_i1.p1 TRINITY_DN329_c0_g1~~TRINITY_DN329_c0_g1_i1.p1  ORF type:complete len:231 (-),score=37.93 TRINITY_DN329_c0_g1_i1:140-832(-)
MNRKRARLLDDFDVVVSHDEPKKSKSRPIPKRGKTFQNQTTKSHLGKPQLQSPQSPLSMPNSPTPTLDELQKVQRLIEKCLQLYMNEAEIIIALQQQNIEPNFTRLVWIKLQEQNPDFFKNYHTRLRLKEQITAFNYLVSQQAQMNKSSRLTAPPVQPNFNFPELKSPIDFGNMCGLSDFLNQMKVPLVMPGSPGGFGFSPNNGSRLFGSSPGNPINEDIDTDQFLGEFS